MLHKKTKPDNENTVQERSLPSRLLNYAFETVLIGLAVVVVVAAIGPIAGLWRYEVIESGSMTPALRIGGVAVVSAEPVKDVKVGQILAFHPPKMKGYVRIHRVIELTHKGDQTWIVTKGDANNIADPGPVRLEGKTAYTEHFFVPYIGYGAVWLYRSSTRRALEIALFTLMVGGGLFLIWGKKEEEVEGDVDNERVPDLRAEGPAHINSAKGPVTAVDGRRFGHRHHAKPAGAHAVAETAATASMVALNNIYGGAAAQEKEAAPGSPTAATGKSRAAR